MKTQSLVLIAAAGLLTAYLATHPPIAGQTQPGRVNTAYTPPPPAIPVLDTPELVESVERMNRKAELLNKATRQIRRNSVAIERDTRELLNAVKVAKDSTPPAPVDVLVPEPLINASTAPERSRFWHWLSGVFKRR